MDRETKIPIFLACTLLIFHCSKEPGEWDGWVEKREGFRIVHNSNKGLWQGHKKNRVALFKTLELGTFEGDENFVFSRIADVEADSKGNIYVLDQRNYRVQKFDRRGNYLLTIGRKGKGPGEFLFPQDMVVDSRDNLYVLDMSGRISKFDPDGNFLSSFNLWFMSKKMLINSKDELILVWAKDNKIFHIYDSEGNLLRSFGDPIKVPYEAVSQVKNKSYFREVPAYRTPFSISVDKSNSIYYANPYNEYEIVKYNESGRMVMKIKRVVPGYKPPRIRRVAHGSIFESRTYSTLILEDGKILNSYYREKQKRAVIDIYDKLGRFLLTFDPQMKAYASSVDKKVQIYFVVNDPYPQVIRASISFDER